MSEPDLAKQAIEESAASVPKEAPAAVGAVSPEDGVAVSPVPADAVPRPQKESATYLRDTRGLLLSVVASAGLLPVLLLVATDAPTPADQVPLPAAPAAALAAPSLAAAVTIAPVAPLPAPDGSGSGSGEAAGQPAAYEPVDFAWVSELEDGPYLLNAVRLSGRAPLSGLRPICREGDGWNASACYGHAFQSYRGTSPNPSFDSWMQKKFLLGSASGTRCEAVAEDVGLLAWFTDFNDYNGFTFVERLRAEDGSIPAQPELGLPAFSKDDPNQGETFEVLVRKNPTIAARITMQAAKEEASGSLHSAVKLRIVSKDEACAPIESSKFSINHIGRSAELPPIALSAPIGTTKQALGLVDSRLWPSSKDIDKNCRWRGRQPLLQEYDFAAAPSALTWVTPDGTEHAWADYRKFWPELPTDEPDDGWNGCSCYLGLVIEGFWKRKLGAKRWIKDLIDYTPDCNDYAGESSDPPFLIVDMKDGKAPCVVCHDVAICPANSNPLISEPPSEMFLNDT